MVSTSFLKSGDVKDRLKVTQRSLQTLSPYILHLYLPPRKTCLWPEKYITTLSGFLHHNDIPPDISGVWSFARLPETCKLIRTIRLSFVRQFSGNKRFTVNTTAQFLGVGEGTLWGWLNDRVITSTSEVIKVKQGRGECNKAVIHVPAQEIRKAFEWRFPAVE